MPVAVVQKRVEVLRQKPKSRQKEEEARMKIDLNIKKKGPGLKTPIPFLSSQAQKKHIYIRHEKRARYEPSLGACLAR